jgi:ferredoxin-NADP reductase
VFYLKAHSLPPRFYFICGPPPLMSAVEEALLDLGVSIEQMLMERFNLV